jgi:Zn-dependent protease with chaperone function
MMGLLQMALVSATVLALVTWSIVVATRREPRSLAWWLAPWWVPAVVLFGALLPSFGGVFGVADHCLVGHSHHHHHLCVLHPPHAASGPAPWWGLLALWMWIAARMARAAIVARRRWRTGSQLVASARPSSFGDDVRLLDDEVPLALTLDRTVVVSRGLVERAKPETLEVVIAHERAHVARRDGWRAVVAHVLAAVYPRAVAARMQRALVEAREAACDDAAAALHGRIRVAAALTEVARLRISAHGVSVAAGSLEARVRRLLDPTPPTPGGTGWIVLALLLVGAGPGHEWLERLVHVLVH